MNLLVGVGGHVEEAILSELLCDLALDFNVKVLLSNECRAVNRDSLPNQVDALIDADEWDSWKKIGDPVLHIELRKWADLMIVWPASAHTIAKLYLSMSDDLITNVIRAWDDEKPIYLSPCAHPLILSNPLLSEHLKELTKERKMKVVPLKKRKASALPGHLLLEKSKLEKLRETKQEIQSSCGGEPAEMLAVRVQGGKKRKREEGN